MIVEDTFKDVRKMDMETERVITMGLDGMQAVQGRIVVCNS